MFLLDVQESLEAGRGLAFLSTGYLRWAWEGISRLTEGAQIHDIDGRETGQREPGASTIKHVIAPRDSSWSIIHFPFYGRP